MWISKDMRPITDTRAPISCLPIAHFNLLLQATQRPSQGRMQRRDLTSDVPSRQTSSASRWTSGARSQQLLRADLICRRSAFEDMLLVIPMKQGEQPELRACPSSNVATLV